MSSDIVVLPNTVDQDTCVTIVIYPCSKTGYNRIQAYGDIVAECQCMCKYDDWVRVVYVSVSCYYNCFAILYYLTILHESSTTMSVQRVPVNKYL